MGSSRVMGWLPLDDDCVRVILLFLRTGDVFAARASGLDCDSLLESDWEERLQEQPRPWAASVLFFWCGAWAAPFGRASFRRSVPRSSLVSRSLEEPLIARRTSSSRRRRGRPGAQAGRGAGRSPPGRAAASPRCSAPARCVIILRRDVAP